MTLLQRIKDDWRKNWAGLLSTVGFMVMIGLVSYNAGVTNGMVWLCESDNGTLVKHISGEIYCEYNYIAPIDPYETPILNMTEIQWHTT